MVLCNVITILLQYYEYSECECLLMHTHIYPYTHMMSDVESSLKEYRIP